MAQCSIAQFWMIKISEKHDGLPNFQLKLTERGTHLCISRNLDSEHILTSVSTDSCPDDFSTGNNFDSTKSFFGDNHSFLKNLLVVSDMTQFCTFKTAENHV